MNVKKMKLILLLCCVFVPIAHAQTDADIRKLIKPYQQPQSKRTFKQITILGHDHHSSTPIKGIYTPNRKTKNMYQVNIEIAGRHFQHKTFLGLGTLTQAENGTVFGKASHYVLSLTAPDNRVIRQIRNVPIGTQLVHENALILNNPNSEFGSYVSWENHECVMTANIPAKTLHPKLKGEAGKMDCKISIVQDFDEQNPVQSREESVYFLKDYNFFLPTKWEKLDVIL